MLLCRTSKVHECSGTTIGRQKSTSSLTARNVCSGWHLVFFLGSLSLPNRRRPFAAKLGEGSRPCILHCINARPCELVYSPEDEDGVRFPSSISWPFVWHLTELETGLWLYTLDLWFQRPFFCAGALPLVREIFILSSYWDRSPQRPCRLFGRIEA